ncbi:SAM-dependent methyltransferase [Scleromatobacter humisilvae]|uniref:SAM-dependent methyltransferase n=1 Tax=Scleromatobacter humisilvae TaxID=2897159 RepID=A0A9X1YPM2_9BURK|nr:SAM-dependent methyltransferase [Scleromatobacter humisilvae]MCK9688327.1 SAM-dependent methyltransferase [Scleromatobacter humisilvae]
MTHAPGRLLLMPNALDLGAQEVPLTDVLAGGVIAQASRLLHWVVEDARSARAFLNRVNKVAPLAQPLQQTLISELPRAPKGAQRTVPGKPPKLEVAKASAWELLLAPALAGADIGLLSEAGLPGVADPGALLVAAAHELGIPVVALSGPSSITLAIAASGLNGQSFVFHGYLQTDVNPRRARLRELEATSKRLQQTQVFIETPYRNAVMLEAALEVLQPTTRLAISCGLTLPDGWSLCRTAAQWKAAKVELPDRVPAVFSLLG